MMKLSHFFFLILIPVLYSCSSDEHYLDFTIEKQDIKIAKAFWGRIKILSGNMDYSINNLNSDIAEAYIYEDGEYGNIVIKPIQKGKATIEITDNICHTSIIIKAEVVDNEIGTIIRESIAKSVFGRSAKTVFNGAVRAESFPGSSSICRLRRLRASY